MKKNIIVIAEHRKNQIKPITYELIAFGKKLEQTTALPIKMIVIGAEIHNLAVEIARNTGLEVTAAMTPKTNDYSGEFYSGVLKELFEDIPPRYVCVAHTSQGLDFAPALAAGLNAACITGIEDIIVSEERLCFARSLYGGKLVAQVYPLPGISVLTIQPGFFSLEEVPASAPGVVDIKTMNFRPRRSLGLGLKPREADNTDVTEAEVVVAAGQGVIEKENLDLIRQLASLFPRSAVAGSRIVCDLGWLEYRSQVGVTGATVSPQLYIACGISGAVQHVAGMRGSEFIVAINRDPAAAIFQVADICVVEDLTTFIPILVETHRKLNAQKL